MKFVSTLFTTILFIPFLITLYYLLQYYFADAGVTNEVGVAIAKGKLLTREVVYSGVFVLSLILTKKRLYIINCILFAFFVGYLVLSIIFNANG